MKDFIISYRSGLYRREFLRPTKHNVAGKYGLGIGINPPFEGKTIDTVMNKFMSTILPGVVHWQHPRFFAYFPAAGSYASILGTMLLSGLSVMGFEWSTSPANTELELSVTRWLGNAMGLPHQFMGSISDPNSVSFMVPTSSEAVMLVMLAAREERFKQGCSISKLVAYSSRLAHVSIKKAALILNVNHREVIPSELKTNEYHSQCPSYNNRFSANSHFRYGIKRQDVEAEIQKDIENGLVPFFLACTLGTTELCSFDQLQGMEIIASKYSMWLHVDASYAGVAFICPEFRMNLLNGVEHFHSFSVNPYKWMLMGHDGCCLWTSRRYSLEQALNISGRDMYLFNSMCNKGSGVQNLDEHLWNVDFRKLSLATSHSFLSLKLWMIFELYGLSGMQNHIRGHVRLANLLAKMIRSEKRLKLILKPQMGVVCFKLTSPFTAHQSELFLHRLNKSGRIFITGCWISEKTCIIRVCICSEYTSEEDIRYLWRAICYELNRLGRSLDSNNDDNDDDINENKRISV